MTVLKLSHIRLSLLCYLATALLLLGHVPWLLVLVGLLAGSWRIRVVKGLATLPKPRWVKLLLLALFLLTLWLSRGLGLFDKLVALVMLGYSLKYIELHVRRDIEVFVLTGLFLVALSLVFSSQPLAALLALLVAFIHLLLLLSLDIQLNRAWVKQLALWLLGLAPLALALFVLAPRLPPLWQMPNPSSAQTGLSEEIRPGDISQLIRSDKLVFRAEFAKPMANQQLYWRAMVLDQFDGERWRRSELAQQPQRFEPASAEPVNQYQVLVEPAEGAWLASLNPSSLTAGSGQYFADKSWQRRQDNFTRQLFQFDYLPAPSSEASNAAQLTLAKQLPAQLPATIVELAEDLQQGLDRSASDYAQRYLAQLEQWFMARPFSYTLNPPAYPGLRGIASFLFEQQRGFCVHYAQSVVVMARLQGIPARMVAGYLGGEWEQSDQLLAVRNYDAHAWLEFWNGQAWQRLDPTAWIAPDRVENSLQQSQSTAEQWRNLNGWGKRFWYTEGMSRLRYWFAQADYWWARWVLNFDQQRQLRLFASLMAWLPGSSMLMLSASMLFLGIVVTALLFAKPWRWRLPAKPVLALRWQLWLLARYRLRRQAGETLSAFVQRVECQAPKRAAALKQAVDGYQQAQYHPSK
ncbi:transglutaminase TgpA family protein [Agarivorans sp.]|uniref:transglutaminase TgpA family protein n=1 Tax=Agarivorans sp. TaxID=1872412 RepID=UPI003D073BFF